MIQSHARTSAWFVFLLVTVCLSGGSCAGSAPRYTEPSYQSRQGNIQDAEIKPHFNTGNITVDIYPQRGEGYIDLAVRISHNPKSWKKLRGWNRDGGLQAGRKINVPFEFLNTNYRMLAIKLLFPKDNLNSKGWQHVVTHKGETMWFIAETFTGEGEQYIAIQKANNKQEGETISLNEHILIPFDILSSDFSETLPEHPELTYSRDSAGNLFAEYELKSGEALYSAVVVRFTGRIEPDDVNSMVDKILRINGIADPRSIRSGTKIKIPFDDLSDDFANSGKPDRTITVKRDRTSSRIYVILDAGHGGSDPGTIVNGLTEDEYAYDIVVRTKKELERKGARVFLTVSDPNDGLTPRNRSRLINGKGERLNTAPNWTIRDSRISVNLRVYLVDSIYQKLIRQGVKPKNIYLISIHLDSLHPSIRGAMVYYPDVNMRRGQFRAPGSFYRHYAESKRRVIKYKLSDNRRAASYSYDFGRELIKLFKRNGMPIHEVRPIRPFVYRNNSKWAPAIVRYSKVPNSILLEVVNMSNKHDLALLKDHRFRQKTARLITNAIL
ncbi:MAG: N-acetylmuramoyl-L-alanine amidase [Calditrichaeota bacterium]|nr:MAG: N-acetylmuramoyl-L-alanine amidase [Calditrichota bacterium]